MPNIWGFGFDPTNEEEEVYKSEVWQQRRIKENDYYDWYSGKKLESFVEGVPNPENGERTKRYPLAINPVGQVCRIHRNVLIGMVSNYDTTPIQTVLRPTATTDQGRALAQAGQQVIMGTWDASNGASIVPEAALLTQVHGGHVFKVAWEPDNLLLPYRIRIASIKAPMFLPVYDATDFWNLRECYIGYPIGLDEAKNRYGIEPKDKSKKDVLYLEHWTRTDYQITVDGIVPEMDGYGRLEGDHRWGRVPVVYIPHFRDGEFFGVSHVPDLTGLTEEKNARSADRGDAVREHTHPPLVAANLPAPPKMMVVETDDQNRPLKWAINIGRAQAVPNSPQPSLTYAVPPNIPQSVLDYDNALWTEIRKQADVASVAQGDDDVSGGRITGPTTSYRMWPTLAHTQIERMEFANGLKHIANIVLRMAQQKQTSGAYRALKIDMPEITEEHLAMQVTTTWYPQIQMEVSERVTLLNARLQAQGISLHQYLDEMGVKDIDEEEKRIWADREKDAELQIKIAKASKPPPAAGGGFPGGK